MKIPDYIEQMIERIDGRLYDIFVIKDGKGMELQRISVPLKVELRVHDVLEIIVRASILAVPIAFAQEVWDMGAQLPWLNVLLLSGLAILFMGSFVYFTSYRRHIGLFRNEFCKRVVFTYLLSVVLVGLLLTIVDQCPWPTDFAVAMKRTLIRAFPACLSATLTDTINN